MNGAVAVTVATVKRTVPITNPNPINKSNATRKRAFSKSIRFCRITFDIHQQSVPHKNKSDTVDQHTQVPPLKSLDTTEVLRGCSTPYTHRNTHATRGNTPSETMPNIVQHISEDDYQDRLETQAQQFAEELVLLDETQTIDGFVIGELITEELNVYNDIWNDASCESIAQHADNETFDPYEDLQLSIPADDIIRSVAYHTLHTALSNYLDDYLTELQHAHFIHLHFNQILNNDPSESDSPSELLDEFNRWLVRKYASQQTFHSTIDYDDFNEQHIRGIQAIDVTNEEVIERVWEWLTDTVTDFPAKHHG